MLIKGFEGLAFQVPVAKAEKYKGWAGDSEVSVCENLPAPVLIRNEVTKLWSAVNVTTRNQATQLTSDRKQESEKAT